MAQTNPFGTSGYGELLPSQEFFSGQNAPNSRLVELMPLISQSLMGFGASLDRTGQGMGSRLAANFMPLAQNYAAAQAANKAADRQKQLIQAILNGGFGQSALAGATRPVAPVIESKDNKDKKQGAY